MWLVLVLAVIALRRTRRTRPGYRRWAVAGLLQVISLILLSLRWAPAWINTISANSGFVISSILYLEGAREFRGRTPRSWLVYAGGLVAVGAVVLFCYIVPNVNGRAGVMSTFLAIVFALASFSLLRGGLPGQNLGQKFTGAMFALCAATLAVRALYCYFGPLLSDRNAVSGLHGVLFLALVAEFAALSSGLTLMADELVVTDLTNVEERMSLTSAEVARHIEIETALRESEERFRFAQEVASIGTFDWNIQTGVNKWTPELEAMYGLSPGGFPGTQKAWEDLLHPDDRAQSVQLVTRSFETGTPVAGEWRVIWPDGSIHWIAGRWQVVKNAAGELLRLTGINIDVTDRKNVEDALRKSEERFRLAIKATNDAIWDYDLQTGTISWNETYSTLYGRPPETSTSWQWWIDNIHPEDRERTVSYVRSAIDQRVSSWACEYRFRRVDGGWAHVYDRAYVARNGSGNAWRVVGAMQDLTERKRVEAAVRESEERFSRVFEEGPLGLALVGRDYRFFKVNNALCQMVGYPEEELVQKTFADITHQDDVLMDVELAERLFKREIPFYRIQKRYVKKSGEVIWINLTASVVHDREGQSLYGIAMVEDITEVKQAQEKALARQKLESVGVLAGGIAHDFNNLLGGILGQAELIETALPVRSSLSEEIQRIKTASIRGAEIVRELMIYAGKESAVVGPVDVSQIIDEMFELLKVSVSKHAVLNADLGKELPAVQANGAQLQQIVMNLVTNASEALGDRDGVIRVTTKCVRAAQESSAAISQRSADSDYVQLEVSDTGDGMTLETQAKVFDPFFTTKAAGRGLGLAVVQGIVGRLGGSIHLTSEQGKGTTFQILLPSSETATGATRAEISAIEELADPSRSATVLVVEDEEPLRDAVVKMLLKSGFEVFEATDGSSAIELLRTKGSKIDVVLLDNTIPGAASRDVAAEAVIARRDIRVLLTSAYSEEMIVSTVSSLPQIRGFIRKPFLLTELVQTLRRSLP
jgi:PAS domain S-box-containing protein